MSRKHNVSHKQTRGVSNYPKRLRKRGETRVTVRMPDLESLRAKHKREGLSAA